MFLSSAEHERRKQQLELERGITPEVKRQKEVTAGVITASVGTGASIFLFMLMQRIILSLNNAGPAKEIL